MYESPIEVIYKDIQSKITQDFENNIVRAVQSYGINVNQEELMKALNYDRNQYNKGYTDARTQFERPSGRWIMQDELYLIRYCSECRTANGIMAFPFCPWCGAEMIDERKKE